MVLLDLVDELDDEVDIIEFGYFDINILVDELDEDELDIDIDEMDEQQIWIKIEIIEMMGYSILDDDDEMDDST